MTAQDILKIASTVGVVQLACNLVCNYTVFGTSWLKQLGKQPKKSKYDDDESANKYQKAIDHVHRTKAKVDKEEAAVAALKETKPVDTTATTASGKKKTSKKKSTDQGPQKRLKRAQDDHADACGAIGKMHVLPNILTSIVFILLLRILGIDFKGKVVGLLPFVPPLRLLQKITTRGLALNDALISMANGGINDDGATAELAISIQQVCSFLFVYALSTMSVKFYVNKLFGTHPPQGLGIDGGVLSYMESPQGRKFMKQMGVDNPFDALKED